MALRRRVRAVETRYPGAGGPSAAVAGSGDSEYGGGDGTPGRFADGSSRNLVELSGAKTVGERARLLRQVGAADYDPASVEAEALQERDSAVAAELRARAERLRERTNAYSDEPEQYMGEPVGDGGAS